MDKELNSCLMLTVNLDTPVDLGCIFDTSDLKDTGIELDSHITILYAQGKKLDRRGLLSDIVDILGDDFKHLSEYMSGKGPRFDVFDFFELGSFENDSDYVVLKLKANSPMFDYLSKLNKGISEKFGIVSEYSYTPHMTLAELNSGTADKYLKLNTLNAILKDSQFDFEDFMLSYGTDNEPLDRKQYFLTQNNCVDRYFRLKHLKEMHEELMQSK